MSFETACHNDMQLKQESVTFGGMTQLRAEKGSVPRRSKTSRAAIM